MGLRTDFLCGGANDMDLSILRNITALKNNAITMLVFCNIHHYAYVDELSLLF